MRLELKNYLFDKHILVREYGSNTASSFDVLFALANKLGIKITKGKELASLDLFEYAASRLGIYVPDPFYRGFPETVRKLTKEELLFDQLLSYYNTYYLGNFNEAEHSRFEEDFERIAFRENTEPKNFVILEEEDALKEIFSITDNLLLSTRPLGSSQYDFTKFVIKEYDYEIKACASKDLAAKLLADTENVEFVKFLNLSDVVKVVEYVNHNIYLNNNIKKLNFENRDRKLISKVLDAILPSPRADIINCYEKKAIWAGILHHIHYKPKCETGKEFLSAMRGNKNLSVYSEFEGFIKNDDIKSATDILLKKKGSSVLLRNLNYILSRCKSDNEIDYVLSKLETNNTVLLIQLILSYANYKRQGERTFKFTKYNLLKKHTETKEEVLRRKSTLSKETTSKVEKALKALLKSNLYGKLGSVYIDPDMKKIALPIQSAASNGGYGCLATGSRIAIPDCKKLRAFTYWEKVDDIDLSVIGFSEKGKETEFSWRSMYYLQSDAITYSGDETSGFKGGSEYFDIKLREFKKRYPGIRYLAFSSVVFSGDPFSDCVCRAGYMVRDNEDSGEIYEPKTVNSAFTVDNDSTVAYLFALDLKKRELIWLNLAEDSSRRIIATESTSYLIPYFKATDTINMYSFFSMMASKRKRTPDSADIIVSDKPEDERPYATVIHSYDFDKILAYINS